MFGVLRHMPRHTLCPFLLREPSPCTWGRTTQLHGPCRKPGLGTCLHGGLRLSDCLCGVPAVASGVAVAGAGAGPPSPSAVVTLQQQPGFPPSVSGALDTCLVEGASTAAKSAQT
ncbi:hypothetical protein TREES_T100015648 [Tupaia chinensis]|uniref:Uncharacterized protein n=1 Tax=Tupaia chinensis TaxID=246437 RepID=L9L7U8_TUPCH|nr:hypothetical protein TREES_T100015648 [Tupaia chinensis]